MQAGRAEGRAIVEELSFVVAPADLEAWVAADQAAWDEVLAGSPGFLGKQVWVGPGATDPVRVVVWWASPEAMDGVRDRAQEGADRRMGPLHREPEARILRLARSVPPHRGRGRPARPGPGAPYSGDDDRRGHRPGDAPVELEG